MFPTNTNQFLKEYSVIGRDLEYSTEAGTFRGTIIEVRISEGDPDYIEIICDWVAYRANGESTLSYEDFTQVEEDGDQTPSDDLSKVLQKALDAAGQDEVDEIPPFPGDVFESGLKVLVLDEGYLVFSGADGYPAVIHPVGSNLSPRQVVGFPEVVAVS